MLASCSNGHLRTNQVKVLISGAHGFLGSHLTEGLLSAGDDVTALVSPWGDLGNLAAVISHPRLEIVRADLTDPLSLAGICDGVDAVVHAAARVADWGPWEAFRRTNVEGTRALLASAQAGGSGRFVFISSVAVHRYSGFRNADTRTLPRDNDTNPYAYSKILAEDLLTSQKSVEPVIVRPGLWPFGPRDRTFERVAHALARGTLPLVKGGEAVLNTSYAGNFVTGVRLALTRPEAAGNAYVISDDGMPSWRELFAELAELLGGSKPRLSLPGRPTKAVASGVESAWSALFPRSEPPVTRYRAGLMLHDVHFSNRHAREELGYEPETSWVDGLKVSVERLSSAQA